jgi:hypothetical protein
MGYSEKILINWQSRLSQTWATPKNSEQSAVSLFVSTQVKPHPFMLDHVHGFGFLCIEAHDTRLDVSKGFFQEV